MIQKLILCGRFRLKIAQAIHLKATSKTGYPDKYHKELDITHTHTQQIEQIINYDYENRENIY